MFGSVLCGANSPLDGGRSVRCQAAITTKAKPKWRHAEHCPTPKRVDRKGQKSDRQAKERRQLAKSNQANHSTTNSNETVFIAYSEKALQS
jgi:hypothetical protein